MSDYLYLPKYIHYTNEKKNHTRMRKNKHESAESFQDKIKFNQPHPPKISKLAK